MGFLLLRQGVPQPILSNLNSKFKVTAVPRTGAVSFSGDLPNCLQRALVSLILCLF
ncbi:hypothetical protein Nmel_002254, partial [Mimus melanotis]